MRKTSLDAISEFQIAEYHESANAYFKGVDIGYTTLKNYISINGLFVALIGVMSGSNSETIAKVSDVILIVAPVLAISFSAALAISLPHYFIHLENCRKRCQEIEELLDGQLFTRLGTIAHKEGFVNFNTEKGLIFIMFLIIMAWTAFIYSTF